MWEVVKSLLEIAYFLFFIEWMIIAEKASNWWKIYSIFTFSLDIMEFPFIEKMEHKRKIELKHDKNMIPF